MDNYAVTKMFMKDLLMICENAHNITLNGKETREPNTARS